MARRIAVSSLARADLIRLRQFIASESKAAAALAIQRLLSGVRLLRDFPELGVAVRKPFRHLILPYGRSAYVVRYRVTKEEIVIVRIWHGREKRPL